jgi:tellurite resistance protein
MNWVFDELLDGTVAAASEHGCGSGGDGSNEHARMLYSFFKPITVG